MLTFFKTRFPSSDSRACVNICIQSYLYRNMENSRTLLCYWKLNCIFINDPQYLVKTKATPEKQRCLGRFCFRKISSNILKLSETSSFLLFFIKGSLNIFLWYQSISSLWLLHEQFFLCGSNFTRQFFVSFSGI